MDDEIAETYLLDSILTLVDAKHGDQQLDSRQEARRQVGFADQIFISRTDLVDDETVEALIHRVKHMNPRAPQTKVNFGEVPLKEVFDLKGFNLNAKLDIDPDFLKADEHDHDDQTHDHEHGEIATTRTTTRHDDDVKSFVFRADKAFDAGQARGLSRRDRPGLRAEDAALQGRPAHEGADRKVIFQGVHQLMGSDLGPKWAPGEKKGSKMVFIGIDLPRDILKQGLEQCLV